MTPLFIVVLMVCSFVVAGLGNLVASHRFVSDTRTAAEAMALAATIGGDLDALAASYDLDGFSLVREADLVTVRVWRRGAMVEASAFDHRRTLVPAE